MLTNAVGLFACGTAFDKGWPAIYINLAITVVGMSVGESREKLQLAHLPAGPPCPLHHTSCERALHIMQYVLRCLQPQHHPRRNHTPALYPTPHLIQALACSAACGTSLPPWTSTPWPPGS